MDLFEILFVALILLYPILEQVLKKGRGAGGPEPGPKPGPKQRPARMEREPGEVSPPSSEREPVKAADMVPDDLWAILTGEQRPTEGVETTEQRDSPLEPAGRMEDGLSPEPASPTAPDRWEDAWTPRPEPEWRLDEEEPTQVPVAPAPYGPEAYTLERLDHEATSLEEPLESPSARHRRFHETIGSSPGPRRPRPRTGIGRVLGHPKRLRQAFVLSEVLGTPKGLE